ncbi:MAG: glycosyltransferase family 2 protein [Lachnospiraceae bacterium]
MEKKDVVISVIIPVYNTERYLKEAVDSVLEQTFPDWELILVDDGSEDDSGNICEEYAERDCRIQTIHTENRGVSNARNTGIEHASGEWIVFLDSDDIMQKNMLETLLLYSGNVNLVVCGILTIPNQKELAFVERVTYYDSLQSALEELDEIREGGFYHSPVNKLYRRHYMTMRFHPDITLGEDFCFNLEYMSQCGAICAIPDMLYSYRILTENSLTKKLLPDMVTMRRYIFYHMLTYMGTDEKIRECASVNFIKVVINQCMALAASNQLTAGEKRKMIHQWTEDDFFRSEELDLSATHNTRYGLMMQLLKRKQGCAVLFLCKMQLLMMRFNRLR